MTGTWEQRMNNPDYLNWLKLGQCLLYMCEGIGDFTNDIINNFHGTLQRQIGRVHCVSGPCQTRRPQTPPDNQCPTCGPWKTAILKEHAKARQRNWKISWGNCDPLKWPTHSWEVAKVYMPVIGNHANKCVGPATTDTSGLLNLIINCKVFHTHFSNVQTAENVRGVRNKVMHASKMSLTNMELQDGVKNILQLLQDGKELVYNQKAQDAVKLIKKIQQGHLVIEDIQKSEKKLIKDIFISLEQRINDIEEFLPCDFQNTLATFQGFLTENADLKETFELELSSLQTVIKQHGERISSLEGQVSSVKGRVSIVEGQVSSVKGRVSIVEGQVSSTRNQISTVQTKLSDLQTDVDSLKETSSTRDKQSGVNSSLGADCAVRLRDMYDEDLSVLQPIPWCVEQEDFDSIYTDLHLTTVEDKVKEKEHTDMKSKGRTMSNKEVEVSINDVLKPLDGKTPKRVLIQGYPGSGKTTLCSKIAKDWASNKLPGFKQFEMVLLFHLRDMDVSLKDSLFDIVLPEECKVNKEQLWQYITENQDKVCILLDGLDEIQLRLKPEILKLIKRTSLRNCTVIVTSRIDSSSEIVKSCQKVINCKGFSEVGKSDYIKKYFNLLGNPSSGDRLVSELSGSVDTLTIDNVTSPMDALIYCLIWEDHSESLPMLNKYTQLYNEFLICIVRRFCCRETKLGIEMYGDEIPEICTKAILALGKLALHMTLAKIQSIDVREIEKLQEGSIISKLGFLFKVSTTSKIRRKHLFSFVHLTFQDFLASKYLSILYDENPTEYSSVLENVAPSFGFGYFQMFCCGFLGDKAAKLFQKFEGTNLSHSFCSDPGGLDTNAPYPYVKSKELLLLLDMVMEIESEDIIDQCASNMPSCVSFAWLGNKRRMLGQLKLLRSKYCAVSAVDLQIVFDPYFPISEILHGLCNAPTVRYLAIREFHVFSDEDFLSALSTLVQENENIEFLAVDCVSETYDSVGPENYDQIGFGKCPDSLYEGILTAILFNLSKNTGIKCLRIGRGSLDSYGMSIIIRGLESAWVKGHSLKQLSLVGQWFINYVGWKLLYKFLVSKSTQLETLELRDVEFLELGPMMQSNGFLAILHAISENCSLKYLDLTDCKFEWYGKYVGTALRWNTKLESLDLSHTDLTADHVLKIFKRLARNKHSKLHTLNLSRGICPPSEQAREIRGLPWIQGLLGRQASGGIREQLMRDALGVHYSLQRPKSFSLYLRKQPTLILSKTLLDNKSLTSLNLSFLRTRHPEIFNSLSRKQQLLQLNLMGFCTGKQEILTNGVKDILENSTSLQSLNLSQCDFDDNDIAVIAPALERNSTLIELDLSRNHLTSKAGQHIVNALSKNPDTKLRKVCLNETMCGHVEPNNLTTVFECPTPTLVSCMHFRIEEDKRRRDFRLAEILPPYSNGEFWSDESGEYESESDESGEYENEIIFL